MKDGKLISKKVHKLLFKKGLVNNLPRKYKKLMYPEELRQIKKLKTLMSDVPYRSKAKLNTLES